MSNCKFVDNLEDLNKYYKFDESITIELLDNYLTTIEQDYILPILGEAFFTETFDDWNEGNDSSDEILNLVEHIQRSIVELAAWASIDEFNVSFGAHGLVVINDKENGIAAASEARTEKLRSSLKRRGFKSIDRLITYLLINKSDFATWTASPEYGASLEHFVNTTKEFNRHSNQTLSNFIFIKIRAFIELVEQQSILEVLGQGLFDEIKTQIKADTLSADNLILLRRIQPALVYLAFSKAILPLGIHIDGFGLSMFNNSFSGSPVARQNPETVLIDRLISESQKDGLWWLNNLSDYLKNNADSYQLYKDGDSYIDINDPANTRQGVIKLNGGAAT